MSFVFLASSAAAFFSARPRSEIRFSRSFAFAIGCVFFAAAAWQLMSAGASPGTSVAQCLAVLMLTIPCLSGLVALQDQARRARP